MCEFKMIVVVYTCGELPLVLFVAGWSFVVSLFVYYILCGAVMDIPEEISGYYHAITGILNAILWHSRLLYFISKRPYSQFRLFE